MEFLFFIALCVGVGMFAKHKGRSPWAWGILSMFISPLLSGIILALMKDLSQEQSVNKVDMEQQSLKERMAVNEMHVNQRFQKVENQLSSIKSEVGRLGGGAQAPVMLEEGMKQCPHCGEAIKQSAVKCRYCGSEIEPVQMKECPFCKELIRADATKCKFCRSDLTSAETTRNENTVSVAEVAEEAKGSIGERETNSSSLLCPNCHNILASDAKFCDNCGVPIKRMV